MYMDKKISTPHGLYDVTIRISLGTGPQGTVGAFRTGGENVFTEFVCNVIVLCS